MIHMGIEKVFGVIAALAFFGFLIYLPVRFFILIGQVKSLEKRFMTLADRMPITPPAKPSEAAVHAPAASPPAPILPPPLPIRATPIVVEAPPPAPEGSPLFERLRDLSLLPPADLKGEYALGAWWAVRVGGLLALAAVVFFGIWLNLRSTIPPVVRVLEVVAVGAGLFWGGLRLGRNRPDLGQVMAAAGLAAWQFAAWATYGLDKMRLFESPAMAALVQFTVALVVAVIALRRGEKLFGQLAVVFASVAVYFSARAATDPWATATGAWLVAVLGVLLLVRGNWGSAGVLALVGSQAGLLFLYDAMPTQDASYLPLMWAALGSFIVFWVGERLTKDDEVLFGRGARSAFQLAAFLAPSLLALFLAQGGAHDRAIVALLIAAVAAVLSLTERSRSAVVAESLLLSVITFAGASLAWMVDPHLVWLIWILAAASAQFSGTRTGSGLTRWGAEILALVAGLAFVVGSTDYPWLRLSGLAGLGILLVLREDWERPGIWAQLRRCIGIAGLAAAVLSVQVFDQRADHAWPWLVLVLIALARFRPALVWAALPGYLFTSFLVVFGGAASGSRSFAWAAVWSAVVVLLNLFALWRSRGHAGNGFTIVRYALAFATAIVVFAFGHHLWMSLLPSPTEGSSLAGWRLALLWSTSGVLLVGATAWLRRVGISATDLSLTALGACVGFFLQGVVDENSGLRLLGLAQAPFVILGLGCLLQVLAVHTQGQGAWGTVQRSGLGAALLFLGSFVMLSQLPGAGVSLGWAVAAMLTFVLGHLWATRSLRMVGLIGLGVAVLRVLSHDITDILGRIAACAAVAIAFFGIAWLYGRITAVKPAR